MRRTDFGNMHCPIARSLDRVGEWWSILILRDAFYGLRRFDEFQKSLGVAPNMLTRRLSRLVETGLLERRRYSEHPPRYEYVLTESGRDFQPVLLALLAWGNRHFAPEGASVQLVNLRSGAPVEPVVVDLATGEKIAGADFAVVAGPGADDGVRRRLAERGRRPFAQASRDMSTQVLDRGAAREAVPDGMSGLLGARRHFHLRGRLLLVLLGLIAAGGVAWYGWDWWRVGRFIETTNDAYVGGNVTTLSPHVAGFVAEILVGDNQFVHSGQLLIQLDDRDYRADLAHAEAVVAHQRAALANLRAKYTLQQSMIHQAEADLAAQQAEAGFAHQDAVRYHALAVSSFGSLQTYQRAFAGDQKAEAAVRAGAAGLAAARQQLAVLDTEIAETDASLAQAQADLRSAQLDLGYTRIRSPIDGYVGDRAAQIGAYTTVGTALLSIVPAHGLWIDANFKEDELARMRPGQRASIVADVLPDHTFEGRVLSLAPATGAIFSVIPPENATGNFTKIVQRVPVRIMVADGAGILGLLRPGLSAVVSVDTRAPGENGR